MKCKKHSIAIITCWYGDFPWYFPYFIHSCSHNPSVDFLIVTDNITEVLGKPDNVKIIHKTLAQINFLATKKLGFAVNIENAYKLCDFKPAYGFLFQEILDQYDFWGHGDLDVVYGDIRNFMTEEILSNYDVISSRHDYITGTFCLFRNTIHMNTLFMQSRDYGKVLSSSEHYCFDECNFLFEELQNGASIFDFPENIQSMTFVVKQAEEQNRLKAHFDFIIIEGNPGKVKWIDGKIIYKDEYEAMFYHLIKFKSKCKFQKALNPVPNSFLFTPTKVKPLPFVSLSSL
jgi:hypothetical protein